MNARRPMLSDLKCEIDRLREELECERAARRTADGYVAERGESIRQLEEAVDIFKTRCSELAEALAHACATPSCVTVERDFYRDRLAEIEAVLRRVPLTGELQGVAP